MGTMRKKPMPFWAQTGHKRPVTRRDFLSAGLIPFAVSAIVPGALGLLAGATAEAAECAAGTSMPSFISLNLQGGAGLAANYLPRTAGGDLLSSYSRMGNGNNSGANALSPVAEFGVTSFYSASGLLAGLRSGASATALANTAFVAMCVQSRDDNGENKFDASGIMAKMGLIGSMLPNLGTRSTASGLNMASAIVNPPSPLIVGNVDDIANSIGYTRSLKASLTVTQHTKLARLVASLSSSQAQKLNSITSTAGVKDLIDCAGIKNSSLVGQGADAITPSVDVLAAWGVNTGTNKADQNRVFGTMAAQALLGNAGTVNLEIGGYDYHDGTRSTGDQRDAMAGQTIGRILRTAELLNKKVFVYVTSDGATGSNESDGPGMGWSFDRGTAGLAFLFAYDPAGRPATTGSQIGAFTNGQVADDTSYVGSDPANAAAAAVVNYLNFAKRPELLTNVFPTNGTLSGATLAAVTKIS